MKNRTLHSLWCLSLPVIFLGCDPDSPFSVLIDPPRCSIASIQKSDASWPQPAKISLTVKNGGEATAYDVECDIKLKSGNTIIDEGIVYFGTLESQESCAEEAWFMKIATHSEYSTTEYHLFWYDSQGDYHQ